MTIRSMLPADVPQIAALERLCFSDPWSEGSVAGELENALSLWLVAEEDGTVRGYIGSQSVAPDARRQGLGQQLLQALLDALHRRGIERVFLEVRPTNVPARALYAALGFEEIGRRKEYYVNPVEDALILRKELLSC